MEENHPIVDEPLEDNLMEEDLLKNIHMEEENITYLHGSTNNSRSWKL
jgi:hypothetical protein